MIKIKIVGIRQTVYKDLIEELENKIAIPCEMELNKEYISYNLEKPEGFCDSAWETLTPFIIALAKKEEIYEGWMKDKNKALVSCNDGFRPMSFLLERIK